MSDTLSHQLATLPAQPGVYLFKNDRGDILYVGKAKILRTRVQSYFRERAALDPAKEPRKIPPAVEPRGRHMVPSPDLDPAKQQMVGHIASLETIITDNENEALILEANLIRKLRPPYNVVLTDDKYYLFIKITTTEEWPRIFPVRRLRNDGNRYFGPYSSARAVRQTLKLLRRIFPYRAEKDSPNDIIFPHPLFGGDQNWPRQNAPVNEAKARKEIAERSEEAPTERAVDGASADGQFKKTYEENIRNIIRFLQGDRQSILDTLNAGMRQASTDTKYERAAIFRDQYQAIERLEGFQKVFLPRPESFDVISIVTDASRSAANVLAVRKGKLLDKNTFLLKHQRQTNSADILRQFLLQYYRDAQDIPPTILVPEVLPDTDTLAQWINPPSPPPLAGLRRASPPIIAVPHRGKKRQLMRMGELNAQQLLAQETAAFAKDARLQRALADIAKHLQLPVSPERIETYDISNIQGKQATGSMVVFSDGQPDKGQYRKFRIKMDNEPNDYATPLRSRASEGQVLQEGKANDYAMIQQVLRRRFSQRHGDWKQPSLVLIDGGKGQLNAARAILKELNLDIPLASIAKREEILFFYERANPNDWPRQNAPANLAEAKEEIAEPPGEEAPTERAVGGASADGQFKKQRIKEVRLPFDSDALYLIQRMRDEAHRFGVTYHRLLRSKQSQRSILDEIPGIGPGTKKRLLNHFGSLKNIRAASDEELSKLIGAVKTASLRNFL